MAGAGARSISSQVPSPTSPTVRSPVAASKEKRHGLRNPEAQISWRAEPEVAYGLPAGIE